jgi:hypothetical protein
MSVLRRDDQASSYQMPVLRFKPVTTASVRRTH